jgi:histidine triad (HIT) family protein
MLLEWQIMPLPGVCFANMPECLFCEIAARRAPASIVWEDESAVAFLDVKPLFFGHVLLVPRPHYATLTDVPASEVGPLFVHAQMLTRAVEKAMGAEGTFVAMNNRVSQSVPHLHIHVVPRKPKDGLKGFFWPRTRYQSDDEREEVCRRIQQALL